MSSSDMYDNDIMVTLLCYCLHVVWFIGIISMSFDLLVLQWYNNKHLVSYFIIIIFSIIYEKNVVQFLYFCIFLTFLILLGNHERDNGESSFDERDCWLLQRTR